MDLGFTDILAFESVSIYYLSSCLLSMYYGHLDINSHASLFWDSDTRSTICWVDVISGHSCIFVSVILSYMY